MDPELRRSFEELKATNYRLANLQSPGHSFWRGVLSGIGATIGAGVAIAILASILHQLAGIDLFKPFAEQVLPYVERNGRYLPETSFPSPVYQVTPSPEPDPSASPASEVFTPSPISQE